MATRKPALDPLPYAPAGYQWVGCRSAWPILRNGKLSTFSPRMGFSQDQDDYS